MKPNEVLVYDNRLFFLATMHFDDSCEQVVANLLDHHDFGCAMFELDENRYRELVLLHDQPDKPLNTQEHKRPILTRENPTISNAEVAEKRNQKAGQTNSSIDSHTSSDPQNSQNFTDHLFSLQQDMGKLMGITPGIDMFKIVGLLKARSIPVQFIDLPFAQTIEKINDSEKAGSQESSELVSTMKQDPIEKKDIELMFEELEDPDFIGQILSEFRKTYPGLFDILVSDRNEHMASEIYKYASAHPQEKLLVVTGAAHSQDLYELVKAKKQ